MTTEQIARTIAILRDARNKGETMTRNRLAIETGCHIGEIDKLLLAVAGWLAQAGHNASLIATMEN